MKFLLAFASILATAMAGHIYGNSHPAPIYLAPAQPIGLYQVSHLAPVSISHAAPVAPAVPYAAHAAPAAPYAAHAAPAAPYAAHAASGAGAIDSEVLSLAKLALSLPNLSPDTGYSAGNSAY